MAINQDLETSDMKVALSILFSYPDVIEMLFSYYPSCHYHQFSCIIAQTIALSKCFVNKQPLNTLPLKNSVLQYLNNIDPNYNNSPTNPLGIVSAILVNFHCFSVSGSCYDNEEVAQMSCQNKCILHKIFYLNIEESSICECGRSWISKCDDSISQTFDIGSLFEEFNLETSQLIGIFPKYSFRDPQLEGNSFGFYKKISNFLVKKLKSIVLNSCVNISCGYSKVSVSYKVKDPPKIYIIDIIYRPGIISYLESFLMTISIEDKIWLKDIYENGQSEGYGLDSIVFLGKGFYYAKLNGKFWEFPGLHSEAGWYELIQEALVMNLHPVSLIYKQGVENKIPDLSNYKLLKLEQSAVQCDFFVERFKRSFIPEDYLSSGIFIEKKNNKNEEKIEDTIQTMVVENPVNEWVCECGQHNIDDFDVCSKCSELKPGVSGWVCKSCYFKNDVISIICSACDKINKDYKADLKKKNNYSVSKIEVSKKTENSENGDWTCECKCQNTKDFEICQQCYKLKPGVDGWVCVACKGKNEESDYLCRICDTAKSGNYKPDQSFWVCEKCKSAISSKFSLCENCYLSDSSNYYDSKFKPCKKCNKKSPLSVLNCYWCKDLFEKDSETKESLKKNSEWECPFCSFENTSNYYNCENCKKKRSNFDYYEKKERECSDCHQIINSRLEKCNFCIKPKTSIFTSFHEEDDLWECKNCTHLNESWRSRCNFCSNNKNSEIKIRDEGSNFDYPEWICHSCSRNNSVDKDICQYCHTRKIENKPNSSFKINCQDCGNEIDEVICKKCKKIAKVSEKFCQICKSDVKDINICYECSVNLDEGTSMRFVTH